MPAYQLYVYEAQEKREALEQKICEQVDACTEVNGTIRNRVKKFLIEEGITDISEMDAVLRVLYEEYLERNETVLAPITCLRGFDGIVIHRMKEELQTLAGRRNYTTEYREQWMCLSHYPEIEIAGSFLASKDGKELLWNFTMECPRNLKMQIFTVLKEVIHTYQGCYRKEKLLALQRFYQFCAKHQVADIEIMTLTKEQQFEQELSEEFRGKKRSTMFGILRMSRKILFLQAPEIHWNANVWFLERFHFSRERMNPSKPVEWVSFKEVTNLENQKILQKYLRYLFGITDLSISTIRIKLLELRTFLVHFNGEEKPIYEVEAEKIQRYLESVQRQDTREKTANGRIFMILQFYNFLVVKGYLKKIPFRHVYYMQKEVHVHNDRSVPERIYTEILSKLAEFPEHLRFGENYMTAKIAENLVDSKVTINKSIFTAAWEYVDEKGKKTLMFKCLSILEAADFENCFSELSQWYSGFCDRSKKHSVELPNNEESQRLAKRLQEVSYITSYKLQEKEVYDSVTETKKKKSTFVCWIKAIKG